MNNSFIRQGTAANPDGTPQCTCFLLHDKRATGDQRVPKPIHDGAANDNGERDRDVEGRASPMGVGTDISEHRVLAMGTAWLWKMIMRSR